MITLRPYQIECVQSIMEGWSDYQSQLAVLATGLGKSTIAADVVNRFQSALVMAHRRELIHQLYERITEYTGRPVGVVMGAINRPADITVASVQSLKSRALTAPELIVIDEAHHAVASTYREVLGRFPNAKILGVTATPDRADKQALGSVFEKVAFRYETTQAILDGWLAPIFTRKVSGVSGLLGAVGNRKTIIFTPNVREAIEVASLLPNATYVHGELPGNERDRRLAGFREGEYQFCSNCNVLTEGFDLPSLGCVCMMRATQSRGVFMQALGRGLRLAPGKSECLFLDLVDMPAHSLEGPSDALAGKELPTNSFWRRFFK